MAIDYSVIIPAFIDAFATRASYDDVTYCDKYFKPEGCKDLVAIAKDGQISAEEAKTFGSDWQQFIAGIAGRDGKALQWARITYLQDCALTMWNRWDEDDLTRAGMIGELAKYPGYVPTGTQGVFLKAVAETDDCDLVRGAAILVFRSFIINTLDIHQDMDAAVVLMKRYRNDSNFDNAIAAFDSMLPLVEKFPELKPVFFELLTGNKVVKSCEDIECYDEIIKRGYAIRSLSSLAKADSAVRAFLVDRVKNDGVPWVRTVAYLALRTIVQEHPELYSEIRSELPQFFE